ncbi:MAG: hypothetical protein PUA68_05915 [Bacilli bacterium]|nr:hypothetical protein [Bacilli bacterium]
MLEIILLLLGGLIAIYIACSIFLSNFNKLIYGKGTILAWLPFTSIYLMGKLAFNNLVGWGLLVICILSSSYTVTVNGVETVQTIAPSSIQGPLSKIYPLLNFGVFVYCIVKYNKLKKSSVPPMPKTFVEKNLQPVQPQPMVQPVQPEDASQSQSMEQVVQPQPVQPQPTEQTVQQNVQSQPTEQQVQTEVPVQHTEVQTDITNQQPVQEEPKKFFNTEPIDQQDNQVSLDQVLNMSFDEVAQPVEEHTEQEAVEQVVNEPAVEQSDLNKVLNMSFNEGTVPVKEVKPQSIEQQVQQNVQSVQPQVMEQPVSTQQETIQNNNQ